MSPVSTTWREVCLGDICSPKQHPTISAADLTDDGYPAFGANGQIGFYKTYTHDQATIAITCRGATCGKVNVVPAFSYISGNAMALDNLDQKRADLKFLVHLLQYRGLANIISGSAQPQITRTPLQGARIPLPPLPEQRRIAAILDQADALRAKRREALAKLDEMAQAIFVDTFGVEGTAACGTKVVPLADIVRNDTMITYGIVQAGEEFPGGVPYIRTGDLVDGEIRMDRLRHTDPALAKKFKRSRVETGDIVMSIRATVGTTALVPSCLDGANLTQGTAKISPGDQVDKNYLLTFLRNDATQAWIERQVKGATFREITLSKLRELPVAVPPLGIQRNFAERLNQLSVLTGQARNSLTELGNLFAALQHRAFSGAL